MNKDINIWEFVEKHYPNYSGSDEIASESDLQKILKNEFEIGDCAHDLLNREYNGDINHPDIRKDHLETLVTIYEKSIYNYLKLK